MYTKESESKKELYKSPSFKVIAVSSENLICTSPNGTERYHIIDDPDSHLDDDDFE